MSAMTRAIRACGGATSRRNLSVAASKEAPTLAAALVADRRAGRDPGEDGSRVQWVFLGCPGVGKGTYAGRLSRLLGVPPKTPSPNRCYSPQSPCGFLL
ncbi:hypothetical protein QYE76_046929 [Lolium multiflorum]|uniref:Adenylate kinase n=1 Tax=Lolium multiflorum TaxID=4521 RepID=A0AAD8TQX5_LOLMU|nr:hypothetical protein QYE76_046929 [Lolium multiflorum]